MDDSTITRGSSNVFADIGLPEPDAHLLKARIVIAIGEMIKDRKLSQTAAAARMGVTQPDLSKLLRGRFTGFSLDRLLSMVMALGNDVEIKVKPVSAKREGRMQLRVA
jgi:predicted XRE-type DNA-binding protein